MNETTLFNSCRKVWYWPKLKQDLPTKWASCLECKRTKKGKTRNQPSSHWTYTASLTPQMDKPMGEMTLDPSKLEVSQHLNLAGEYNQQVFQNLAHKGKE